MSDFKLNSHRSREPERNVPSNNAQKPKKVIKGKARVKNRVDIASVGSYLLTDFLIPNFKDLLWGIIKNGAHMMIYSEPATSEKRPTSGSRVSYERYYEKNDDRRPSGEYRAKSKFDYEDIIFDTRPDAERVLMEMRDTIAKYRFVSINELYDMAELTPPPYTSDKFGWSDLRNAHVVRYYDGYVIKLPRALPID